MRRNRVHLFGEFTKVEKLDDGTVKVTGFASSEAVDSYGDVVTAAAMRGALPGYMKWGAVREMHGNVAAGAAINARVNDDGKTEFEALVVDEGSCKKLLCDPPVLKGLSIGGHVPKGGRDENDPHVINALVLTEVSLVDRPANPDCAITLVRMQKGLWHIGWCADLLSSLNALQHDAQWEAEAEGDGSTVPAKLKQLVVDLAQLCREICEEETSELTAADAADEVAGMTEKQITEIVQRSVTAALATALPAALAKAMPPAPAPVAALSDPEPPVPIVDPPVAKAAPAPRITLDANAEELETTKAANATLTKRVAELEAAAAPKGVLKAIGKGEDVTTGQTTAADVAEAKTATDAIKLVHKAGATPYFQARA